MKTTFTIELDVSGLNRRTFKRLHTLAETALREVTDDFGNDMDDAGISVEMENDLVFRLTDIHTSIAKGEI
jgi:hypothetical protein